MPLFKVTTYRRKLPVEHEKTLKALGSIIGYDDPDHIWVETIAGFRQTDIATVLISVSGEDRWHPRFREFCSTVATVLRHRLKVNVEVCSQANGYIETLAFAPTAAGIEKYGREILLLEQPGAKENEALNRKLKGMGLPPVQVVQGASFTFGEDTSVISGFVRAVGYSEKEGAVLYITSPKYKGKKVPHITPFSLGESELWATTPSNESARLFLYT